MTIETGPRNLDTHPYRVMLSATVKLQAGGETTRTQEHCGVDNIDSARKTVQSLRDYASRGAGFHHGQVINSAWIEYTMRTRMEF